jgi:haloalkane dehalogenase
MHDDSWVDRTAYPFRSRYFEAAGGRIHYVDEGAGRPVVMVHGTSAWSFLYRDVIKALAPEHRCIALDHLGYGLSDKPGLAGYSPADHAARFRAFVEHLGLRDITLVVHDFGGPIGLSYAIDQPDNVRSLVLFNTWMWSLRGDAVAELASRVGGGTLGRLLVRRLNLELLVLLRAVWGDRSKLDRSLHRQYLGPHPLPRDRHAMWVLAGELLGSSAWYDELWNRREAIRCVPALLLWGMKDPIFRKRHLARWQGLFTDAQTMAFPAAGHFVQEEAADRIGAVLREYLQR